MFNSKLPYFGQNGFNPYSNSYTKSPEDCTYQRKLPLTTRCYQSKVMTIKNFIHRGGNKSIDTINVTDYLKKVQSQQARQAYAEQNLPYAIFNGYFTSRAEDCLQNYSQNIVIDVPWDESNSIILAASKDPSVKLIFWCCVDCDWKMLVHHDNTEPGKHKFLYADICKHFNIQPKPGADELCRTVFLPHYDNEYWNPNTIPFHFDASKYNSIPLKSNTIPGKPSCFLTNTEEEDIFQFNKEWENKHYTSSDDNCRITTLLQNRIYPFCSNLIVNPFATMQTQDDAFSNEVGVESFCLKGIKFDAAYSGLFGKYGSMYDSDQIRKMLYDSYKKNIAKFGRNR